MKLGIFSRQFTNITNLRWLLVALILLSTPTLLTQSVAAQAGVQVELRLVIEHVRAPECFVGDFDRCERQPDLYALVTLNNQKQDTPRIDNKREIWPNWVISQTIALDAPSVTGSIEILDSESTFREGEADLVPGAERILHFSLNPNACLNLAPGAVTGNFGASKSCNEPILADGDGHNPTHIQFRITSSSNVPIGPNVIVRDELTNPVGDAEVWHLHNGVKTVLRTDGNGQLLIPNLQKGDQLVAMQMMRQEEVSDPGHDDWSYRVYRTNFTYDTTGNVLPQIVDNSNCCTPPLVLVVKKRSPLVLFNLVVSVGWDSHSVNESTVLPTFLKDLKNAFREASQLLFDVTDGQFAFGAIAIYDGARYWREADIQVAPSNFVRPYANAGGIIDSQIFTYTSPVGNVTVFHPGHIRTGRAWNRYGHPDALWSAPDGYRTLVHEFAHYAFMLFDEYFYINSQVGRREDAFCEGSIMFHSYVYTELDMQNAAAEAWQESCKRTEQFSVHGVSAWETLADVYADTTAPPRWEFRLPEPGKLPMPGPAELPFELTTIKLVPPTQSHQLANITGEVTLNVKTSQGQPLPTAHPQVFLIRKNSDSDWHILEQGTTNENGVIELVGVKQNDTIFATTWDGKLFGSQIYQSGPSASLYLASAEPVQWPPMITAQPISDTTNTITGIAVTVSQFNSTIGDLLATLIPIGGGSTQTIHLIGDDEKKVFKGNFNFVQGQTLDEAHIWLREVYTGSEEIIGIPPRQVVTTYSIGGSPDSHKRLNPSKDPTSSDGYCQFHFPSADWTKNLSAIVLPTRGLPDLPGYQIVSAACYIGIPETHNDIPPDSTLFNTAIPLTIYYNALAVKGIDDTSLKIYRWNSMADRWQLIRSNAPDERNYLITGSVLQPGLYVAAAPLPTQLALSERVQPAGEIANAVGSPQVVSALNTLEVCPNASALVIDETGVKRFYANAKAYVNNLTDLQPGETYFVTVGNNCTIQLGANKQLQALTPNSAISEPTKAITLSTSTLPATFYGKVKWDGQNLSAGLPVIARIHDQVVAQSKTFTHQGESVFVLDIWADNPDTVTIEGGRSGDVIIFQVDCSPTTQIGTWQAGQAHEINLALTNAPTCSPQNRSHQFLPQIQR